jgi:hypothetical protein
VSPTISAKILRRRPRRRRASKIKGFFKSCALNNAQPFLFTDGAGADAPEQHLRGSRIDNSVEGIIACR